MCKQMPVQLKISFYCEVSRSPRIAVPLTSTFHLPVGRDRSQLTARHETTDFSWVLQDDHNICTNLCSASCNVTITVQLTEHLGQCRIQNYFPNPEKQVMCLYKCLCLCLLSPVSSPLKSFLTWADLCPDSLLGLLIILNSKTRIFSILIQKRALFQIIHYCQQVQNNTVKGAHTQVVYCSKMLDSICSPGQHSSKPNIRHYHVGIRL